jgi:FkbM family methyltransferase
VEGNEAVIPSLRTNRAANNCHFQIENAIISSKSQVKFFVNTSMVLSGLGRESDREIFCRGIGIRELEQKYAVIFDFLIMDIEGGEHAVVLENIEYLSKNIRGIILETHPDLLGDAKIREYETALYGAGFQKTRSLGNVEYFHKTS